MKSDVRRDGQPMAGRTARPRLSLHGVATMLVIAVVATALAVGYVVWNGISDRSRTIDIVAEETASLKLYEEARSAGFAESASAALYLAIRSETFLDRFEEARARVDASLAAVRQLDDGDGAFEGTAVEAIQREHDRLAETYDLILATLARGDEARASRIAEERDLTENARDLWDLLDAASATARENALAAQEENAHSQAFLDKIVLTITAAWTVLIAAAGLAVFHGVVQPVRRVAAAARRIADGDAQARAQARGPVEIAGLAADVNLMAESLMDRSERLSAYLSKDLEARTADLERVNEALYASEQKFRSLVQHAPDLITVVDRETRVRYQSPSLEPVLGYQADELIGTLLLNLVHDDDVPSFLAFLRQLASASRPVVRAEVRLRHRDGSWRTLEMHGSDRSQEPVGGIVLNSRDVSERRELEQALRYQAFHDPLTGLANRALFADRLQHALARAERSPRAIAVLFVDLDAFKAINDSLGHTAGDAILIAFSERLKASVRPGDTVARMGGDEFAVLVEVMNQVDDGADVAERILATLQTPFRYQHSEVLVRASIGIAATHVGTGQHTDAEALMRRADIAMYAAKRRGRARAETYDESMHHALSRELELLSDLRLAVTRNEFFIEYQPTFNLRTGEILGMEALVRWQHPRHGLILPDEFIPLAEESSVIIPLGSWVLKQACRQMADWQKPRASSISLSVNVSVRQILESDIVSEVQQILGETGLEPARLVLEITESITMYPTSSTLEVLNELKRLGVRLAIDDFGMGSSSLSYLRRFPFDIVKIDKSFVQGGIGTQEERELMSKIVELGRALSLEVLAEGIEREEQLARLCELDCASGQGFLFSHPLAADEVPALLARQLARQAA